MSCCGERVGLKRCGEGVCRGRCGGVNTGSVMCQSGGCKLVSGEMVMSVDGGGFTSGVCSMGVTAIGGLGGDGG